MLRLSPEFAARNAFVLGEQDMPSGSDKHDVIDRVKAWQCIGCGKIDAPQPCIGVCRDRQVEFVRAEAYDQLRTRTTELESLVRMFVATKPRDCQWERSYLAIQDRARRLLFNGNPAFQVRKSSRR
jgi:hypothetical protein